MKQPKNKKSPVRKTTASKNNTRKEALNTASHPMPSRHVDDEITDAFIQEVSEDVKNDNLKVLWNRYGLFIVLFVVLAVCGAVSFETLKKWHDAKYQARTENYMVVVQTPDLQSAKTALEKVANNNQGIYSDLARIQIANVLFEQNKNDEAAKILSEIYADEDLDLRIRNLAALKLAAYQVDFAPEADIQKLLQPIADQNSSWSPLAKDLLAMSAIHNGNIEDARRIYTDLLKTDNLSENFRLRIQDMLSALSDM